MAQEILDRLEAKVDGLGGRLNTMDATLTRQADQLTEHMRRTEQLEDRFAPIERAHMMWGGVGKALAVLGTALAALAGAVKLLGH